MIANDLTKHNTGTCQLTHILFKTVAELEKCFINIDNKVQYLLFYFVIEAVYTFSSSYWKATFRKITLFL